MYCEKAQRDCQYLELASRQEGIGVLIRATAEDVPHEASAGAITDELVRLRERVILQCEGDFCALVGFAVTKSMGLHALELVEQKEKE